MGVFIKFDMWLITHVYEPIAWRSEYYFKKDNYWWARAMLATVLIIFTIENLQTSPFKIFPISLYLVGALGFSQMISIHEQSMRGKINFVNYWKPKWFLRFGVYCISFANGISSIHAVANIIYAIAAGIAMVSIFYFLSCNKLPPGWVPPVRKSSTALVPQGI